MTNASCHTDTTKRLLIKMVSNLVAKRSEVLPWSHDKSMGGRGVVVRFTEGKTTVCLQVSDMISYP